MAKYKGIIFGASNTGKRIYFDIKNDVDVIAFVDEDRKKWGKRFEGIGIESPNVIKTMRYDMIYIGVLTYYLHVLDLLHEFKVPDSKIVDKYVSVPTYARIEFLNSVRQMLGRIEDKDGAVAELGVYQGDFAKEINRAFYDRTCYLFDTFEGFPVSDCIKELNKGYTSEIKGGYFSNTSESLVLSKMQYPEKCKICKGFFPESAKEIEDMFCFVNLDADLYAPTLAGLKFFWPRMVQGGVILVHDFFSEAFKGAKEAVEEFSNNQKVDYLPIGDTLSVAFKKN